MSGVRDYGELGVRDLLFQLKGCIFVGSIFFPADYKHRTADFMQILSKIQIHHGFCKGHYLFFAQTCILKGRLRHDLKNYILQFQQIFGHSKLGSYQNQGIGFIRMQNSVL